MNPVFLSLDEAVAIHARVIELFGGSSGLRDVALLQSALGMPSASFRGTYLHGSLAEMAAAYHYHLACNHPFVDGNKRVAATAARVFLSMNDAAFDPTEEEYGDLTLGVAAGTIDKAAVTAFFKIHTRPA